jgi:C1A family cysteine protease
MMLFFLCLFLFVFSFSLSQSIAPVNALGSATGSGSFHRLSSSLRSSPSNSTDFDYISLFVSFVSFSSFSDPRVLLEKFEIFRSNAKFIEEFNKRAENGTSELKANGYVLSLNQFSVFTPEQFQSLFASGFHPESARETLQLNEIRDEWDYLDENTENVSDESADVQVFADSSLFVNLSIAASLDWRLHGAVTKVKQQGTCGSCWSFSVTGAIEGAHAITTGVLIDLSQQQMMDCSFSYGNSGCSGGTMVETFKYIIDNKGACAEKEYNYTAKEGICRVNCSKVAEITSYRSVGEGDELALLKAVNIGPVSVAIQADASSLQFYSSGIYDDPQCGRNLNHAVLLVGYGTEVRKAVNGTDRQVDYWIVKNSWGEGWGEGGYIRMIRGKNQCGIADMASFPLVQ